MKLRGKSIGSQKCAHGKVSGPSKRIILVAGMGTSPAVLTETVWALAHQENPVVPDEITVITTKSGREALQKALMTGTPSVWEHLKSALQKEKIAVEGKLVLGETSIRVFPDENGNAIDDLRTGDDNLRAADFMLGELRRHTEASDTVVFASIAGGRKTMSALLFSCMTLLGREDDKVYHVLIPPEYECGMYPPFFFPQKGVTHQLLSRGKPTGKKVPGTKIGIELFEVPFVRMRGWYQEKFKVIPPSYRTLVSRMQDIAPTATACPEIEMDVWQGQVLLDGVDAKLGATEFAVFMALAGGVNVREIHERLVKAHAGPQGGSCEWRAAFREGTRFSRIDSPEDLNKVMSTLRQKLVAVGFVNAEALVPLRGRGVSFPLPRIKWHNREKLADICGYLFPVAAK